MHGSVARSSWGVLLLGVVVLVLGAAATHVATASPTVQGGLGLQKPPPPANQLLFSPLPRRLALFKGSEVIVPGIFVLVLLGCGLAQLRDRRTYGGALSLYAGTFVFYFGWVLHKWSISGRMTVFQGHLLSWSIAALGVCLGLSGLITLARVPRVAVDRGSHSLPWLYALALFLTLGLATGTATIFEVGPILCGIDAPWHLILAFVAAGGLFSSMTILTVARSLSQGSGFDA